jgi:hypothetical protein
MTNDSHDAEGENPNVSNDLQRFAAELARLQPRGDRLDRERLAFLAGQASVVSRPSQRANIFGVRLDSRAWPAAFAAMSAIAATLLCMLLTRPEALSVPSIATDIHVQERPRHAVESIGSRDVLTTRDGHLADIETRLAKLDANQSADSTAASPMNDLTRPMFTPTAWQRVIHETESAKPLPRKSSSWSHDQGVNT